MKKKTIQRLRRIGIVFLSLCIIYVLWLVGASIKLCRVQQALAADGRPMTIEAIIPPKVDDADNAALLYQSAMLRLNAEDANDTSFSTYEGVNFLMYVGGLVEKQLEGKLPAEQTIELKQLLSLDCVDQALASLIVGTQRPACRFDVDYESGLGMSFTHLSHLKKLTYILSGKTLLLAQAGRFEEAWQYAEHLAKLANALRDEPVLISQIVRFSQLNIATKVMHRLCRYSLPTPDLLARLGQQLAEFEQFMSMVQSFDSDRLIVGDYGFKQSRKELRAFLGLVPYKNLKFVVQLYLYSACKPLRKMDHAHYLHVMHRVAQNAEQPFNQADRSRLDNLVENNPIYYPMSGALLPAFGRCWVLKHRTLAQLRITYLGFRILQYYQTHEAYPETLDALGGDVPNDPFTDAPLKYRADTKGFILYSVAEDQEDDGGKPKGKRRENYDIVWNMSSVDR
ncbi:hypothetical protein ACFL6U_15565 [Planctomycetota bacterium]